MLENKYHEEYRFKYLNAPKLNLDRPVDISLELSSFCNQWCGYCLDPETPVLMADLSMKAIKDLVVGDKIRGFNETLSGQVNIESIVEKTWKTRKQAVEIKTSRGNIISSLDHQFVEFFSNAWLFAWALKPGDSLAYLHGSHHEHALILDIIPLGERDLVDIQTSTKTFYGNGFATHNCYHADKKNLPFKQGYMLPETINKIIYDAADLGVMSVKTNWRGESTMNPWFGATTAKLKQLGFIDRITNSNFKFKGKNKLEIIKGLCNQTKVKVSYDSFKKHVFEFQRAGGDHELTTHNIDLFYNYPGRDNILVIQAVRTSLNKDEDIEGEVKKRWPSALVSIRDMVEGRVNKDLDEFKHKERDYSERQSCIQAHARLIFDTEGVATACCPDIKQELRLGSIKDMTISEIWNSESAKKLREDLLSLKAFENSPCKNCSSFETFKGYKPNHDS